MQSCQLRLYQEVVALDVSIDWEDMDNFRLRLDACDALEVHDGVDKVHGQKMLLEDSLHFSLFQNSSFCASPLHAFLHLAACAEGELLDRQSVEEVLDPRLVAQVSDLQLVEVSDPPPAVQVLDLQPVEASDLRPVLEMEDGDHNGQISR